MNQPSAQSAPFFVNNLYLLIAGLVIGLLAGPYVLGQLAPDVYERLFDVREQQEALEEFDAHVEEQLARVERIGATPEAILPQMEAEFAAERLELIAARDTARADSVRPYVIAVILALTAIMAIETLHAAPQSPVGLRLATARYALIAIWIALMLIAPQPLTRVSIIFVGLLIALALAAAMVPLGAKPAPADSAPDEE